ncbi:MAG: DUF4159 domain-containing protein [Bryobacteraceae bacterium]|nr:DUF4159 domain-containing protein [Bryobacteraceae bacterium]
MKVPLVCAAVFIAVAVTAAAWQGGGRWSKYASEMQNPAPDPPDAGEKSEWAFARLRYRSQGGFRRGGWGTDSNKAEQHFVQGVRRLSRVNARSNEEVIDVDSDEVFDWPWLYAVEVGRWYLSDPQAKRLRTYLDRGGFLMVDDFHGGYEWDAFMQSLAKIFPDRPVVDIPDSDAIFHVLYNLEQRLQVPGHQYTYTGRTYERQDGVDAHWRGVYDDNGRILVAICHNSDLGDAWEWADDPQYPEKFASLAYRIGINYLIYATTH